jgi:ketol-acid reductoisomerase
MPTVLPPRKEVHWTGGLYDSVAAGKESQRSIDSNSQPDYREKLEEELKELRESELWQSGKTVRSLRPENQPQPEKHVHPTSSTKEVFSKLITEHLG